MLLIASRSASQGRASGFATCAARRDAALSDRRRFPAGLLTNPLNRKMALFVLALFPQFVQPSAGSVAVQIMVLATVLNLIGLVVNGTVIVMASGLGRLLSTRGRWHRAPQYLLATVFAGLGLRLAFDSKR
jgi:threonine/homoserine/homoserine lactone efflux protein